MAEHITKIEVGNKKYNLSNGGEAVYYSSTRKEGGALLKGVKYKSNQFVNSSGDKLSNYDLAQLISS